MFINSAALSGNLWVRWHPKSQFKPLGPITSKTFGFGPSHLDRCCLAGTESGIWNATGGFVLPFVVTTGEIGHPIWSDIFAYILRHCSYLTAFDTVYVMVDTRNLRTHATAQEDLPHWPAAVAWWHSRMPCTEAECLLYIHNSSRSQCRGASSFLPDDFHQRCTSSLVSRPPCSCISGSWWGTVTFSVLAVLPSLWQMPGVNSSGNGWVVLQPTGRSNCLSLSSGVTGRPWCFAWSIAGQGRASRNDCSPCRGAWTLWDVPSPYAASPCPLLWLGSCTNDSPECRTGEIQAGVSCPAPLRRCMEEGTSGWLYSLLFFGCSNLSRCGSLARKRGSPL